MKKLEKENSPQRGKRDVPEGVLNKSAFRKLRTMKESKIFQKKATSLKTSDINLIADLNSHTDHLKKTIRKLPESEKKEIMAKKKLLDEARGQMSVLQKKAYGINNQSLGGSVLDSKEPELIELFGSYHNVPDVHKHLESVWGYKIHINSVYYWYKKHAEEIKIKKDEYRRSYKDVRLVQKKARLEELGYLYNHKKEIYEKTNDPRDFKNLLDVMTLIKGEIENDTISVNVNGKVDVQHQIEVQIKHEITNKLSVMEIIMARVAGRMGTNPVYILNRLQNSVYAKFSGAVKPEGDIYDQEPIYPSATVYDFDRVKQESIKHVKEAKELRAEVVPDVKILNAGEATKIALQAALIKKQNQKKK